MRAEPERTQEGMNAVGLAAQYGRPASLGAFFRADASLVDARDRRGRTALHWACGMWLDSRCTVG